MYIFDNKIYYQKQRKFTQLRQLSMHQNNMNKKENKQKEDYFETQKTLSLHCGMHSINNLLKQHVYEVADMDRICYNLSDDMINPHKHIMGGDYDANVIIIGLQQQGYECEWNDNRKILKLENFINNSERDTLGFLLNIQMPRKLYHRLFRFSSRHWLSIRTSAKNGTFVVCDSNQTELKKLSTPELEKYLSDQIKNHEGQLIWVFKNKEK